MSKYLIDEPALVILPSLAEQVGLDKAVILQQVHFWLQNKLHNKNGKYWVYHTYKSIHEKIPFISERTIKRRILELEKDGIVISTQTYNKSKLDNTKWYRIDYTVLNQLLTTSSENDRPSGQIGTHESISGTHPYPAGTDSYILNKQQSNLQRETIDNHFSEPETENNKTQNTIGKSGKTNGPKKGRVNYILDEVELPVNNPESILKEFKLNNCYKPKTINQFWVRLVPAAHSEYGPMVSLTLKAQGQLKTLVKKINQSGYSVFGFMFTIITKWGQFVRYACSKHGAFKPPQFPTISWFLMNVQAAIGYYAHLTAEYKRGVVASEGTETKELHIISKPEEVAKPKKKRMSEDQEEHEAMVEALAAKEMEEYQRLGRPANFVWESEAYDD